MNRIRNICCAALEAVGLAPCEHYTLGIIIILVSIAAGTGIYFLCRDIPLGESKDDDDDFILLHILSMID